MNRGRTAPWAYRNNKAGGLSAPASLERKEWRRHVHAPCVEVQDQPPPRGQSLGPPQEPGQQARVPPRPARPAPPQADRLRHPARRHAESEGLLLQPRRAALLRLPPRGLADPPPPTPTIGKTHRRR